MGQRFLIDTCTIINYIDEKYPEEVLLELSSIFDNETIISFITQIELLVSNLSNIYDIELRQTVVSNSNIEYISKDIIDEAIYIRRESKIKLPDAVIAATAKCMDYTLISCNERDFKKVTDLGVKYLNPNKMIKTI